MRTRSRRRDRRGAQAAPAALATLTALATLAPLAAPSARLQAAPGITPLPAGAAPAPGGSPVTGGSLDTLVREKRYADLRAALSVDPPLAPTERDYFQGVLDNHANAVDASVRLLTRALPAVRRSGPPERLRVMLRVLADDHGKRFEYGPAADTYRALDKENEALDREGGAAISEAERREIRDDADFYDVLRGQPPQTVAFGAAGAGGDSVQGQRDPLGLLEAPVSVGGLPPVVSAGAAGARPPAAGAAAGDGESWVVDTGANVSTITRTTAARLGLKLLSGRATVQGIGGAEIPMRLALVPVLRLGGATVRNAAVLVLDDKALALGRPAYQIRGILGFPVLSALGRLTFGPHDRIGFGPGAPAAGPPNMYLEELNPLVAADTDLGTRLFTLDTGANATVLSAHYWGEHAAALADAPAFALPLGGADGVKSLPARKAPGVRLRVAGSTLTLGGVPVLTGPTGNRTNDAFYGNLGQDVLRPFTSYTLDFRSMRFTLQK